MAHSAGHDIASTIKVVSAILPVAVTAAGSGDSTSATGKSIDTSPATMGARYNAAALAIGSLATMASGESIAVTALVQDSANDSDWATLVASSVVYTHTASGGASTAKEAGGDVHVDMSKARRYIRCVLNPDMSRAGTDTASLHAVWVFGNPDQV